MGWVFKYENYNNVRIEFIWTQVLNTYPITKLKAMLRVNCCDSMIITFLVAEVVTSSACVTYFKHINNRIQTHEYKDIGHFRDQIKEPVGLMRHFGEMEVSGQEKHVPQVKWWRNGRGMEMEMVVNGDARIRLRGYKLQLLPQLSSFPFYSPNYPPNCYSLLLTPYPYPYPYPYPIILHTSSPFLSSFFNSSFILFFFFHKSCFFYIIFFFKNISGCIVRKVFWIFFKSFKNQVIRLTI